MSECGARILRGCATDSATERRRKGTITGQKQKQEREEQVKEREKWRKRRKVYYSVILEGGGYDAGRVIGEDKDVTGKY